MRYDVPISDTDQLTVTGGWWTDRTRYLGEFKPTNTPLSEAEIRARRDQRKAWSKDRRRRVSKKPPHQ